MAENKGHVRLIADVLQPPEVRQRFVIDAAEAGLLLGLSAGEVPSAGSGDALESDTRKLYINLAIKVSPCRETRVAQRAFSQREASYKLRGNPKSTKGEEFSNSRVKSRALRLPTTVDVSTLRKTLYKKKKGKKGKKIRREERRRSNEIKEKARWEISGSSWRERGTAYRRF